MLSVGGETEVGWFLLEASALLCRGKISFFLSWQMSADEKASWESMSVSLNTGAVVLKG